MHCAENAPFFPFAIVLQQFASLCFDKVDSLSVSYNITFEWFTMSLSTFSNFEQNHRAKFLIG